MASPHLEALSNGFVVGSVDGQHPHHIQAGHRLPEGGVDLHVHHTQEVCASAGAGVAGRGGHAPTRQRQPQPKGPCHRWPAPHPPRLHLLGACEEGDRPKEVALF